MIRVIAGKAKGQNLKGPTGLDYRPTTGRVKEFIFSYLGPSIQDTTILDLFSGTGSLGIEALSRGASHVTFVEQAAAQIKTIQSNLSLCGFETQASLLRGDVFRMIASLSDSKSFDLILADPPYKANYHGQIVTAVARSGILKPEGRLIIEHETHDQLHAEASLACIRERKFGSNFISVYENPV